MRVLAILGVWFFLGALPVGCADRGGGEATAEETAEAPEQSQAQGATDRPESLRDRTSYAFGVNLVAVARRNGIDMNEEYLIRGVRDALRGKTLAMTDDEIRGALQEHQKQLAAKRQAEATVLASKNKEEGEAFLAENTKRDGVVTLASGLQYQILEEGSGAVPKDTDRVKVHYRGALLDGKEFDSSYSRGSPATFPVRGLIAGWTEALQLMPVGSKWKLWVPSRLAYGENGQGAIGPNATLVFEVELLGIEGGPASGDG